MVSTLVCNASYSFNQIDNQDSIMHDCSSLNGVDNGEVQCYTETQSPHPMLVALVCV